MDEVLDGERISSALIWNTNTQPVQQILDGLAGWLDSISLFPLLSLHLLSI